MPNLSGLERAQRAGVTEVAIFAASSETFSRKNINQGIDDSFVTYKAVCDAALAAGLRVRGYLSTAFGCPYEGDGGAGDGRDARRAPRSTSACSRSPSATRSASPTRVRWRRCSTPCWRGCPPDRIALHFHDTRGTALANVLTALPYGIATFDASVGGLGGCPYAPGAAGNLATEDLIYMLNGLGAETGVSLPALSEASSFIGSRLDHPLPSRYAQAVSARSVRLQPDDRTSALKPDATTAWQLRPVRPSASSRPLRTASC